MATALPELPLIDEAFGAGRLSYSKVRAATRVAGRVDEQTLLDQSLVHTASQLERLIRGYRKSDGSVLDQEQHRRARWFWDEDGMLVVTARLPADEGAILVAALEQAAQSEQVDRPDQAAAQAAAQGEPAARSAQVTAPVQRSPADQQQTPGTGDPGGHPGETEAVSAPLSAPQRTTTTAADALLALARDSLAAAPTDSSGDDRHLVVLHVDADLLTHDEVSGPATCHLENGPGVDRPTALRITCDAALVTLIDSAVPGENLRLGRKTRKISPALRRALRFRDGGCQFPGCSRVRHLEAHHVVHWLKGGATDLANLVLLCRRHHMAIHDEGFTVRRAMKMSMAASSPIGWEFRRPDGVAVPATGLGPDDTWPPSDAVVAVANGVDSGAIRPGWRGEPFSLADSVAVLCGAEK